MEVEKNQTEIQEIPNSEPGFPEGNPLVRTLFRKDLPQIFEAPQFHRGAPKPAGRRTIAWSVTAALIDGLLLLSLSCFLLVIFSLTIRASVPNVLALYQSSFLTYGIFAEALLSFCYLITLRTFLGFSIGEWACGLRLGSLKQRLQKFYGLKVLGRTLLIFASGILILPLMSLILGRDLPGIFVGLSLIEQKEGQ